MSRRVLVAAEFWHGATGRGLTQGFRNNGWIVEEFDISAFFPRGRSTPARLGNRLFGRAYATALNEALLSAARTHPPALFVTVKGGGIDAATLDALRGAGIRTVNYYPDVEFGHADMSAARLARYDVVATTKSYHAQALDALVGPGRHGLVHHGYSPLVHRPLDLPEREADFAYDVSYVGNHGAYKAGWLTALAIACPALRLVVAGHRWTEAAKGTPLAPFVRPAVIGDDYAALISASRINIGLHSGPVRTPGWEDRVSTRTFEIPACGGFMLHIDNDELRTLFEPGREVAAFDSPESLAAQVRRYLDRSDERRKIAAAGYARAVPAYSLNARALEIIELATAA